MATDTASRIFNPTPNMPDILDDIRTALEALAEIRRKYELKISEQADRIAELEEKNELLIKQIHGIPFEKLFPH